jgi:hypothetical protein
MASRKELKGIAAGIAGKFVSRNNDIDGYWAMGILYEMTSEGNASKFTLDILSGQSTPKCKYSKTIAEPIVEYLHREIEKRGWDVRLVIEATVEVNFDDQTEERNYGFYKDTWGEPYLCRVVIKDKETKMYTFEVKGWCGRHDPKKERRSERIGA